MMSIITILFIIMMLISLVSSFSLYKFNNIYKSSSSLSLSMNSNENKLKNIIVSGFVSKANDFSDSFVFSKIYEKGYWESITSITDDISFAKKRLVNPKTVYSGLIDILGYADSIDNAIVGKDTWLSFNISSSELKTSSDLAIKNGLKRVIFGVHVTDDEIGTGVTYESICSSLKNAGIDYTIVKFSSFTKMSEAKFPYRIVRGDASLPTEGKMLASEDLMRVLLESIDIPKTFNSVYGIGPGTMIDSEVLIYMKSQGWPERVQVGLLMGDMMEKIDEAYKKEGERKEKAAAKASEKKPIDPLALPAEGQTVNKYAGFMT